MRTRLAASIALLTSVSAALADAPKDSIVSSLASTSGPPSASSPPAPQLLAAITVVAPAAESANRSRSDSAGAATRSDGRHDVTATSALPPTSVDSATILQRHTQVPLAKRAFEDAAQAWAQGGEAPVLVGTNGAVMYAYGESHPTITCAPLRICLVHLIAHEHITNMSIGDSVRWLVQSAEAGTGNDATPVVITKPVDANLITNLAITTDAGRVYYLTLHSDDKRYVPEVGFYDPQDIIIRLKTERAAADAKVAEHAASVVDDLGSVDPAALDFRYACKAEERGAERFLPLRVFAGAGHTYVQMPESMANSDAPAIFNVVEAGHHTDTQLINSRLVKGYYVVDGLPKRLKLVVGVGRGARSVVCAHE